MELPPFTERAIRVLQYAAGAAHRFNHPYIGTEHLLLGVVQEQEEGGTHVLDRFSITFAQVNHAVEFVMGVGLQPITSAPGLSVRAQEAIDRAVEQARQLQHHAVDVEHLLLSLTYSKGGATGVLTFMGISFEHLRTHVLHILQRGE